MPRLPRPACATPLRIRTLQNTPVKAKTTAKARAAARPATTAARARTVARARAVAPPTAPSRTDLNRLGSVGFVFASAHRSIPQFSRVIATNGWQLICCELRTFPHARQSLQCVPEPRRRNRSAHSALPAHLLAQSPWSTGLRSSRRIS